MAQKPPAFQFYTKDWLTSETVLAMDERDQGLFIHLLAHSWNSAEPGTLPLPLTLTAKLTAKPLLRLAWFLKRHPGTFREVNGRLLNDKLYSNWLSYKELSDKRSAAALLRHDANASHMHHSASASASAITTKSKPASRPSPSVEKVKSPKQRIAEHVDYRKEETDRRKVAAQIKRMVGMAAVPSPPRVLSQAEYQARAQKQKRELESHLKKAVTA